MTTWETVTPLLDEPEQSAFYEPWQPQVGQRVRVRLSGECRVSFRSRRDDTHAFFGLEKRHEDQEHGRVGIVVLTDTPSATGHRFLVDFDQELHLPDGTMTGHAYAVVELEPLP